VVGARCSGSAGAGLYAQGRRQPEAALAPGASEDVPHENAIIDVLPPWGVACVRAVLRDGVRIGQARVLAPGDPLLDEG
jgi:hypothetical protein